MAWYVYLKSQPRNLARRRFWRRFSKISSAFFLAIGLVVLAQTVLPIVSWSLWSLPRYESSIVSPLPANFAAPVLAAEDSFQLRSWFAEAKEWPQNNNELLTFNLTIPKLDIDGATVIVGGEDLKKSLVAWPNSPLPGNFGNNIIFGHSALPKFSDPKSYTGIFTFLMDLQNGDEIFLDYDGVRYRYQVVDKIVVSPEDLSILEQRFDASYLTLVTCVPPGTLWKRGVIRAKMVK